MKNINTISLKNICYTMAVITMLFCFNSCSQKVVSFQISQVVPAAKGTVKVKKDNNKNYTIKISLSDLAGPDRLQPPKNTYIVWMETENKSTKNIGQINSSPRSLSASLETVSSFKPQKIFITAEDDAGVQYPAGQVILSTDDF